MQRAVDLDAGPETGTAGNIDFESETSRQSCQGERCCICHCGGWPAAGRPRSPNDRIALQKANAARRSFAST